ncbi:addiction module antidote protein [Rugamonas sp. FT107W]|uniref:Addiction module antidote protein n=1 Tax=Duganella vulcania TaxID=2692166 RepID=A0A845HDJ2_9BURK|nr:addiction module antidote protein [Duganella vulcania]MYN17282.1 addiction module antidote protein [Duganella vulcania]
MQKTDRPHEEATIEMFRNDPALAAEYLNDVLATGDEVDLMLALRYLGNAFGDIQEIARQSDANPSITHHAVSENRTPSLKTLRAVLSAMGLRLAVQPIN